MNRAERKERKRESEQLILDEITIVVNEYVKQAKAKEEETGNPYASLQELFNRVDKRLQQMCKNLPQEAALIRSVGRNWADGMVNVFKEYMDNPPKEDVAS